MYIIFQATTLYHAFTSLQSFQSFSSRTLFMTMFCLRTQIHFPLFTLISHRTFYNAQPLSILQPFISILYYLLYLHNLLFSFTFIFMKTFMCSLLIISFWSVFSPLFNSLQQLPSSSIPNINPFLSYLFFSKYSPKCDLNSMQALLFICFV